MTQHFHRELDKLEKHLLTLTAVVEENFRNAIRAVENRDLDLVQKVEADDQRVDDMEVEIEEECLKTLALYQPVAHDLRFIVSALKMNADLERIGDFATRIVRKGRLLAEYPRVELPSDFRDMADVVCSLFHRSVDAFISMDAKEAYAVIALDQRVDQYHRDIGEELTGRMRANPNNLDPYLSILWMVRAMERVGDHASNIAEDVIYLAEGDIVRHQVHTENPKGT